MGPHVPPGLVAVVIPTYNRARLLRRAIATVLAQTSAPDEIIVVDDGSTDDSAAVARSYSGAVRYIRQENRGVSSARNRGVAESSSAFVAFLDDDDVWEPQHLERMAAAIRATDGKAVLYFSDLALDGQDLGKTVWQLAGFECVGPHDFRVDGTEWALMPIQPVTTQASVIRRDAYLSCNGQAESLITREDTHLFLKICLGAPVCAVAGVAGQLRDDLPDARLTTLHRDDEVFWRATTWLYADILRRHPALARVHRRELQRRTAAANLRLARLALRRRRPAGLVSLARGIGQDPATVGRRLTRLITTR